jgi:hypothetical protein
LIGLLLSIFICIYLSFFDVYVCFFEGRLESKLPTIWTDGKTEVGKAEVGRAREVKGRKNVREEKERRERKKKEDQT